jgi:hypothetical protein
MFCLIVECNHFFIWKRWPEGATTAAAAAHTGAAASCTYYLILPNTRLNYDTPTFGQNFK